MTYEELMALALKHYNEGGDGVYECWDRQTFNEYVKVHGKITKKIAFEMFGVYKSVWEDLANS